MPSRYSDDLAEIASQASERLELRNQAREQALPASREVIRFSANAIRAVHRGDFEDARKLLDRAAQATDHLAYPADVPDHAGVVEFRCHPNAGVRALLILVKDLI